MQTITIRGHSDDIISIDGDIREEFSNNSDDQAILSFSDGTILGITYDNEKFGASRKSTLVWPNSQKQKAMIQTTTILTK